MTSEGVGSYWPFATGRRVDQANLLLRQILETPKTRFVLTPNQHVGAWRVGFMPQWLSREYLLRAGRGPIPSRATHAGPVSAVGLRPFLHADRGDTDSALASGGQSAGGGRRGRLRHRAQMLWDFFCRELRPLATHPELLPEGRDIINCCLNRGTLADFESVLVSDGTDVVKTAT